MSSGYFPLDVEKQGAGCEIKKCIQSLEEIKEKFYQFSCEDNTPEDATSDGEYLCRIGIAIDLLNQCLKVSDDKA